MNLSMVTTCGTQATTGTLFTPSLNLYSLELPWANNEPDFSCVPAGTYQLIPYNSPEHGWTYCLHNPALNIYGPESVTGVAIPPGGRTVCELHSANFVRQLLGCIALGIEDQPELDPIDGYNEPAVQGSRNAVSELLSILGANISGHTLTITRSGLYSDPT